MQAREVVDEDTGIGISEDEQRQVTVTGLDQYLPPDKLQSLQTALEIWRYGLQVDCVSLLSDV